MKEHNYYAEKLNSQGLFKAYDTDIPRIKQYLNAEIAFVKKNLTGSERVLELGAGYGRVVKQLADYCGSILGIDISKRNAVLGNEYLEKIPNAQIAVMDVHGMSFEEQFDVVLCLQNGLSAMKISQLDVVNKILPLLKNSGKLYCSTYSEKFWKHRVAWFKEQAEKGLLGELDLNKTKDGVIICKDGFKATTHTPQHFKEIGESSGFKYQIKEVDESSLFLIISKDQA